jgi:hypothetical protein
VLVITDGGLLDPEVIQQLLRLACVLAGDQITLLQHTKRSQRDVLQVAYRTGNEVEARREIVRCSH